MLTTENCKRLSDNDLRWLIRKLPVTVENCLSTYHVALGGDFATVQEAFAALVDAEKTLENLKKELCRRLGWHVPQSPVE